MSNLSDLAGDKDTISKLTEPEFADYWTALGKVVRLASVAGTRTEPPARHEVSTTAASTERRWTPTQEAPATPFGFGDGRA